MTVKHTSADFKISRRTLRVFGDKVFGDKVFGDKVLGGWGG